MFATGDSNERIIASKEATKYLKAWERSLTLRISLQKSMDVCNKIPVFTVDKDQETLPSDLLTDLNSTQHNLAIILNELGDLLGGQQLSSSKKDSQITVNSNDSYQDGFHSKKRRTADTCSDPLSDTDYEDDVDQIWNKINIPQLALEQNKWEPILNKWHARLNFGSEHTKLKLKVFNQTLWDQVKEAIGDFQRVEEKSRMPSHESTRMIAMPSYSVSSLLPENQSNKELNMSGPTNSSDELQTESSTNTTTAMNISTIGAISRKRIATAAPNDDSPENKFDAEVYDDRIFYAMLLKTFITSNATMSGHTNSEEGGMLGSGMLSMRADDLKALRMYKRKKVNVDRRASKGRKVRYVVHDKLQNFMFPVDRRVGDIQANMNAEKLFMSLFQ